jgi:hypothetical protein
MIKNVDRLSQNSNKKLKIKRVNQKLKMIQLKEQKKKFT